MARCNRFEIGRCTFVVLVAALLIFTPSDIGAQQTRRVHQNAKIYVDIPGHFTDSLVVRGTMDMQSSDTTNVGGYYRIETEIIELELTGLHPISVVNLKNNGTSLGEATGQLPGIVFPADYYIDLYFRFELPDLLPGEEFYNPAPIRIRGVIDDMPGYFDHMDSDDDGDGIPESVDIRNDDGTITGLLSFRCFESVPYVPPRIVMWFPRPYNSDVAVPTGDTVMVSAEALGYCEPEFAVFGYRMAGTGDPFEDFWFDDDGAAPDPSKYLPLRTGDGWSGYLDISDFDPLGTWIEFQVCFNCADIGDVCDTIVAFVDPTPPIPEFTGWPPDSTRVMWEDSLQEVVFETEDEGVVACSLKAFKIPMDYERDLTPVDCEKLGDPDPKVNRHSCGPASAACCLKYWADNGYPKLKHPEGDTSRPEQTPEEMGTELQRSMGTTAEEGTTEGAMRGGIKRYLEARGLTGWKIKYGRVRNQDDFAAMKREFISDGEDVLMFTVDTVEVEGTKVAIGHYVTLGSMGSFPWRRHYPWGCVGGISYRVDFMDPSGGGSPDSLNFEVGIDPDTGEMTIKGYRLHEDLSTKDARIYSFISVSPPEGEGEEGGGLRSGGPWTQPGAWILVDTGTPHGSGVPDTLWWNTTGFDVGTYLLQASYTDAWGNVCIKLKPTGIPVYVTGIDEKPVPAVPARITASYPNPFNPVTTIEYTVPHKTMVTLSIYDVAGRRVRRLVDGELTEAGTHRTVWDGRNDEGRRMASGVYFCRLEADDTFSVIKVVLLR